MCWSAMKAARSSNMKWSSSKPMQAFRDEAPALPAITVQLLESEER